MAESVSEFDDSTCCGLAGPCGAPVNLISGRYVTNRDGAVVGRLCPGHTDESRDLEADAREACR